MEVQSEEEKRLQHDLASTFLEDAISGRHTDFNPTSQGVKLYRLYKKPWLRYLLYAAFLIDVSLAFFEKPAYEGWLWPLWLTLTIEFTCIVFFGGRLLHEMMVCVDAKTFWKDTKHITNSVILLVTIVDICVFVGMTESAMVGNAIRISRPLRPFLLVNFTEARQIRRAFRTIRRSLPDLGNVLILFMASLTLFSLMAVKLFDKRGLGHDGLYFTNFFDSFWDLYVLVTTANSPDIMMPAYDVNRAYIFFFVAFLLVNLYLFMRIFLAVIYKSYKDNLRMEVHEAVQLKRGLLQRSYQLAVDSHGHLGKEKFKSLMRDVVPCQKEEYWEVAWLILDPQNNGRLPVEEFYHLADLLDLRVVDIRTKRSVWFPHIYHSPPSRLLIKCVRHIYFRYAFDAIIFANAIFIAFDLDGGEPYFLALFSLEILLKLYAFGWRAFVRKLWNIFDTVVVSSALVVTIVESALHHNHASEVALDFLMVLRVIRIFKIFHSVTRFRIVINTILHILPSMATYMAILLVFYYFFAIIGMELFSGGKIVFGAKNCGNPKLQGSEFARDDYCGNNFNDLFASLVTLFELMTVNQWHILAEGFVLVTDKSARVYFFAFHMVCVTVILNIFSAFVIEAFILELSVTSAGGQHQQNPPSPLIMRIAGMGLGYGGKSTRLAVENSVDDEDFLIDADHGSSSMEEGLETHVEERLPDHSLKTGLRFYLTSRTRTVMGLLEKMFESDLEKKL